MKKKILSIVSAVSLLASAAFAAFPTSYNWEFWGWGGGGAYCSLFMDTAISGRLFAVSDVTGPILSTDGADNWNFSTKGQGSTSGTCLIQAPSSSTTWYRAAGRDSSAGAVDSSTDNGVTWTNHLYGSGFSVTINSHKALAVNRTDANTAYVAFTAGANAGDVWRTTNRTTWTEWKDTATLTIGAANAIVIDKSNTYLWYGNGSGLRRITLSDGTVQTHTLTGHTYATYNADIVAVTIAGTNYIFTTAGNRLAYTTDHGANWTYTATISGITGTYRIARFDVFPGASLGATKIMVGTRESSGINNGTKYKSSDGGATWATATGSVSYATLDNPTRTYTPQFGFTTSIVQDPHDATGNTWYASDYWGIFKTTDFGANWTEKVKGAGNTVITDIDIAPDGTVVSASMDDGILTRKNGDAYWTMRIPNTSGGQAYPQVSGHMWQVETGGTLSDWNAGNGKILATNSPWSGLINKPVRSVNNGATWTLISPTAFASGLNAASGIPDNATFGAMWGNGYMRALAEFPSNDQHLLATIDGTYGGSNVNTTASSTSDNFTTTSHGLVLHDRVMISVNTGGTQPGGTSSTTRYYVVNPTANTFQISTSKGGSALDITSNGSSVRFQRRRDGGLFETTDGGVTWSRLVHPGESTAQYPNYNVYNGLAVNPTDETNWIMNRWASGIWRTTNSGSSWSNSTTGSAVNYCYDVKFSSTGVAYAACDNSGPSIYRSTDKGANWTKMRQLAPNTGSSDAIAIDPDDANSLVVSSQAYNGLSPNKLWRTSSASTDTTSSNNFVDITGNLPDGMGFGACAFNRTDNYLYCGRYAGSVFRMNLAAGSIGALTSTSVTPANLVKSNSSTVTVAFTTATAIPSNGKIKVTFPTSLGSGFSFNSGGTSAAGSLTGIDGSLAVSIASNVVTFTRSGGTSSAAGAKSFTLSFVQNPDTAGSTGTYQIVTTDSADAVLDQDLAVAASTIANPGALTATSVTPASTTASATGNVDAAFTLVGAWPADGKLKLTFPTSLGNGFTFNSGGSTTASCTAGCDGSLAVGIASNVVTLTRSAGTQTGASTACTVRITNVQNPNTAGSTGTFAIQTQSSNSNVIDENNGVAAVTITNPSTGQSYTFTGTMTCNGTITLS